MRLSHFFIDRPVFAAVISIIIVLLGAIAFPSLPIAQYPQIAPPTVAVNATYPGASAEALAQQVADPIESQINGVEDMEYMSSNSTGDGRLTITITFKLGADLDKAQVLVQNRVAVALPRLPQVVQQTGVTVRKSSPDFILAIHLFSPDGSLDQAYIANYATLQIRDQILRVPGVADIGSRAGRDYAIRVWIDPDRAAARSLTVEDIVSALRSHNVQVAAGAIGQPPFGAGGSAYQLNVQAVGRLTQPEQFGDIVVRRDAQGRVTRISDIARVEMGAQDYTTDAFVNMPGEDRLDSKKAVAMGVLQLPGSNALETADKVKALMARLKQNFPPGLDYRIIYNPTDFIRESVSEVQKTLFEALILVVVVVIVFLQSWRAAVIPIVAIPVSLIGTFAVMAAFGFSLNNLSLFGLVLAIGIVVDDAIVVVENVERHLREGMSPSEAAHTTMDEVGGALIAIALVLTAVFVPSAFIPGISGQFYKQFALTIATATLISLVVSLTLSPAMAALIMRGHDPRHRPPAWRRPLNRFGEGFNRGFARLANGYASLTQRLVRLAVVMLVLYAGLLALAGWRLVATPTGFIPAQDQGNLLLAVTLPAGATLQRTDALALKAVHEVMTTPGVKAISLNSGVDPTTQTTQSSSAQAYIILDDFRARAKHKGQDTQSLVAALKKKVAVIPGADIRIIPPPPVRGIGTTGGFKMIVEDRSGAGPRKLEQAAQALAAAATKDPALGAAFATFNTRTPRLFADVDRDKAEILGVPDQNVFDTLQTYLGSSYINDFNFLNHTYQVLAQADAPFRRDESDLLLLQTRSASGAMVPLGSVMSVKRITGPYRVLRYNLYPAAEVNAEPAAGRSTGEAMAAMERLARRVLPAGFGYEWTEIAYAQQQAGATGGLVFILAVVFVFLLLAALYESVTLPLAVILIVPMCVLAALLGVSAMGLENNILTQIGLIVLIGLAAKNAILIVEFARQGETEHGHERHEAAVEAARTRLRPILMTSFAFILGVAPLAFAHASAGAEMRAALGVAVFFGMIGVTVFGLLFTPVFYVVMRLVADRLPKPPRPAPRVPTTGGAPHGVQMEPGE